MPDGFDPAQPDLPTLAVDPLAHPDPESGQDVREIPEDAER